MSNPLAPLILNNQPNAPGGGIQGVGPIGFPDITADGGPYTDFSPGSNPYGSVGFIDSVPQNGDVTEIYGIDNIPQQFTCAPWDDESERYIMPGMMAFCVKQWDQVEGTTLILTLPKLNQVLQEAYNDFEELLNDQDQRAIQFSGYLIKYGERALEQYHQQVKRGTLETIPKDISADLKNFHDMATQDHFCYLTKFGILSKIEYLGVVNNTNRAISLEGYRQNNHYQQVNVIMAKRAEVSNLFGCAENVTTGSILWLLLRRKPKTVQGEIKYAEFYVVPHGCKEKRHTRLLDVEYKDPSGDFVQGHHWTVGSVLIPGNSSPTQARIMAAANIGYNCSENLAYNEHATLPTLYVALGFR